MELRKELTRIDRSIKELEEQRKKVLAAFKEAHRLIPDNCFAKAVWEYKGKTRKGVVYVTQNRVCETDDGEYVVLPTLLKCEPIPKDHDDGTVKHYYSDYWEKQKTYIRYDRLIGIEPFDAPMQKCGKCGWLQKKDEDGNLRVGCSINIGRKTDGGEADACDRFRWWNWEQSAGCTHIEYIKQQFKKED